MWKKTRHFRIIGIYLAFAMFMLGSIPADLFAGMTPSTAITLEGEVNRNADLDRIQKALETKLVSERMADLGLTPDEVSQRISQLDDNTLHNAAVKIDDLQKGSDGFIGTIIGLLVVAILVVLILKLTDHRIVIE